MSKPTPNQEELEQQIAALLELQWDRPLEQIQDDAWPTAKSVMAAEWLTLISAQVQAAEARGAADFITKGWGKRCETKDTEDFPELKEGNGRCVICEMWEVYDEWLAALGDNK